MLHALLRHRWLLVSAFWWFRVADEAKGIGEMEMEVEHLGFICKSHGQWQFCQNLLNFQLWQIAPDIVVFCGNSHLFREHLTQSLISRAFTVWIFLSFSGGEEGAAAFWTQEFILEETILFSHELKKKKIMPSNMGYI